MHPRTSIDSDFALASSDIRPTTNQFIVWHVATPALPSRKGARRKPTDMNQASFSEAVAHGDLEPTVSDHATDTLPPGPLSPGDTGNMRANTDDPRAIAGGRLGSKARFLNTGVSVAVGEAGSGSDNGGGSIEPGQRPSFHINIPWPLVCLPFPVALAHRECSELS
ncbi:hypothetical protein MYCTH_97047 [Thermothelomyces thermophilus ATCC 42464]|uniref:Uncharacterized protein n=1 Tax=Thermothelomyces thermophilus (strain ATCC 42464 / BCRC 31852 / DSM 1799) TaxID=573729 RepID=G2QP54_THET4|nr:uncharacterized protein MYCTH_97047 [Thermothelomyces thermophilus ATCC 42464]AEO61367.1 hypothetical protein MYCTH_97047 [Thermothelomyces thermophilus ATCC 42464]